MQLEKTREEEKAVKKAAKQAESKKRQAESKKRKREKSKQPPTKHSNPEVEALLNGERPLLLFPTPPLDSCVLFWSVRYSAEGHL